MLLHEKALRCSYYRPPTKLWEANVGWNVSVCLSWGWSHVAITRDSLDLTVRDVFPGPGSSPSNSPHLQAWDLRDPLPLAPFLWSWDLRDPLPCPSLVVTSGSHQWRPIQTSIHFRTRFPHGCWHLVVKHRWSVQVDGTHPTGMLSCWCIKVLPANEVVEK